MTVNITDTITTTGRTINKEEDDATNLYRKCDRCGNFYKHCFKFTYNIVDPDAPVTRLVKFPTYWLCPECKPDLDVLITRFISNLPCKDIY